MQAALRAGGHGATDRGGQRVRGTLLGLQVALSVTLLVVTALLVTSFVRLLRIDPGFSPDGVVAVDIAPLASRYPETPQRAALYDRILERMHRQFLRGDPDRPKRFEVVGIVADGRATALDTRSPLMVYVPYWFNNEGKSVLVVHIAGDAAAATGEVRQAVREIDPEIAIADAVPLAHVVDKALEGRRYQMWLFGAFGIAALVIATLGVYATTAYGVSRRRREMNIRVALGARASQVFGLVVRQTAAALAAGCAGAAAIGTLVASLVFEGRPRDPVVIAGVVALVGAVGVAACAAAAKQGLRIDPAAALRDD